MINARLMQPVAVCAMFAAACGPRTIPAPASGGAVEEAGAVQPASPTELGRIFDDALGARLDRALGQIDERAVRAGIVARVFPRAANDPGLAAAARRLAEQVLATPAVREQVQQAVLHSTSDVGAMLAIGSALVRGAGDVRAQIEQIVARTLDALVAAAGDADLAGRVLALPEVTDLLAALLPAEPFAPAVQTARARLAEARSVADARQRLIVAGDAAATRAATTAWAERPPGINCQPLALQFPLADGLADLPAARTALAGAVAAFLDSPAVREEAVALARDLLADAPFRLALDAVLVAALRGDDAAELSRAAAAVVAVPALTQAVAACARRLVARAAELPDLRPALVALAEDPGLVDLLTRLVDVLATADGCVGLP